MTPGSATGPLNYLWLGLPHRPRRSPSELSRKLAATSRASLFPSFAVLTRMSLHLVFDLRWKSNSGLPQGHLWHHILLRTNIASKFFWSCSDYLDDVLLQSRTSKLVTTSTSLVSKRRVMRRARSKQAIKDEEEGLKLSLSNFFLVLMLFFHVVLCSWDLRIWA